MVNESPAVALTAPERGFGGGDAMVAAVILLDSYRMNRETEGKVGKQLIGTLILVRERPRLSNFMYRIFLASCNHILSLYLILGYFVVFFIVKNSYFRSNSDTAVRDCCN
jgi:hypothetical protein